MEYYQLEQMDSERSTQDVTLSSGKGNNLQCFLFDRARLCEESAFVNERLHGDYAEAITNHFRYHERFAPELACLERWCQGGGCDLCAGDGDHIIHAHFLCAEEMRMPRFERELVRRMEQLLSSTPEADLLNSYLSLGCKSDCDMFECLAKGSTFSQDDLARAWPGETGRKIRQFCRLEDTTLTKDSTASGPSDARPNPSTLTSVGEKAGEPTPESAEISTS